MRITEAFDLPSKEEITALGFVVKLQALDSEAEKRRQVDDYVLTPAVRTALPLILEGMRHAHARGEPLGRFVHGSFGSGKSHFLTILSMLLEGDPIAWAKQDPSIAGLASEHRGWLKDARLLTVRIHMLSEGSGQGFDRSLYQAFNKALEAQGKPPFEFLHVDGILEEAQREAAQYGALFWKSLAAGGFLGSKEEFDSLASGDPEDRESLARAYLQFKLRDPDDAALNPNWADGLRRLTQHAKDQGFGGVVFMIDEFLLWLSEKSPSEFKTAINQLTVMVDHTGGKRPLPVFAFVARQRNIQEFFPDLIHDAELHEHLSHHTKRFEETKLEDIELRYICKQRILKKRAPKEIAAAVAQLKQGQKVLEAVLQGADPQYLDDVYPFHPALIEMLIDVSNRLQRERTALRLLYELLVLHYPDLELGKLLPVGKAFEALLPESGVEGGRNADDLRAIHKLYYERFRPALHELKRESEEANGDFDEKRRQALEEVVKTVLLAEASPRLKGSGLTVRKLVHLNDAEVSGTIERARTALIARDLLQLSRKVGVLQVSGVDAEAKVSVVIRGADLGEVLDEARRKVSRGFHRKQVFLTSFLEELELAKVPGFRDPTEKLEGDLRLRWRGTVRRGSVKICNVREQANAVFKPQPGDEFRLLVDLPWDEPGHTVEEDARRARDVQQRDGRSWTVCWLPRHFSPEELAALQDLGAIRFLLTQEGQDELLRNLSAADRQALVTQARGLEGTLQQTLQSALKDAYLKAGQLVALASDVNVQVDQHQLESQLRAVATALLDRRFPQHPDFKTEPKVEDFQLFCDWLVRGHEAGTTPVPFDEAEGKVLSTYGRAFEAVALGQNRATLNASSRYLKLVTDESRADSLAWDRVDRALAEEPYGFQGLSRSLLLGFLARTHGFRIVDGSGSTVDPRVTTQVKEGLRLLRAPLLEVAPWGAAVDVAEQLFGEPRPAHRTLGDQDRLVANLRQKGRALRGRLLGVRTRLAELGVEASAPRVQELDAAVVGLRPLVEPDTQSHEVLERLTRAWTGENLEGARRALRDVEAVEHALSELDQRLRSRLASLAAQAPEYEAEVKAQLESLESLLASSAVSSRHLDRAELADWKAQALILESKLEAAVTAEIQRGKAAQQAQERARAALREVEEKQRLVDAELARAQAEREQVEALRREAEQRQAAAEREANSATPAPVAGEVLLDGVRVDLGAPEALDALWTRLKAKLEQQPPGEVHVELRLRRE